MNHYETVFILTPVLSDAQMTEAVEKFTTFLSNNGAEIVNVENWGLRKLAYPIQKKEQGYYVLVNFEANPESIVELERVYKITDSVLKFITVRKDEE